MRESSRSQSLGVLAIAFILTGVVLLTLLRGGASDSASGIIVNDPLPTPSTVRPAPVQTAFAASRPVLGSPTSLSAENATVPKTGIRINPDPKTASEESAEVSQSSGGPAGVSTPLRKIAVDVAGAVRKPGLYRLPSGSRNDDAVKIAGGVTAEANLSAVNLAAHLQDGTQLYVPTRKEHPQNGAETPPAEAGVSAPPALSREATVFPKRKTASTQAGRPAKSGKAGKLHNPGEGTVNINTAGAEELQRLPGVGPAMAERMLAYRTENHGFRNVEELLHVSGIGPAKFDRIAPFVRIQ